MKNWIFIFAIILIYGCQPAPEKEPQVKSSSAQKESISLDLKEANRLAQLPMECIQNPLPYKSGIILADSSDLAMPQEHHPAFYGCFDWHSAVHGHWSLVYLIKSFPKLEDRSKAIEMLKQNLTAANIEKEIAYFSLNKYTKSFERTYGWAWLLKLQEEIMGWDDPNAKQLEKNLQPLVDLISNKYQEYLPKLVYPIRVGEHSNTAFGLSFAYDYAIKAEDQNLINSIKKAALKFYSNDQGCPINWEPSGYDFLSPCLQEIDLMRKVLDDAAFAEWLNKFQPTIYQDDFSLAVGEIKDRSDGKLVHLDGLNFSRAWCLYPLKTAGSKRVADQHLKFSLDKITDGDYAGQHWLASFALYAFKTKNQANGLE